MSKKLSAFSAVLFSLMLISPVADAAQTDKKAVSEEDTYELLNLFGEVLERAKNSYVNEVSDEQLIQSAINGMLVSLDPHSSYMDGKDFRYMSEQTQGKFGGLGIEVTMESGVVKVVSPIDDTPAHKAGLKPGDYIVNIDGQPVVGMTLNDAVDKMRGKIGSKVKLTIRRFNQKPFDVTIKREEIKIQTVKSSIKSEDVAYVRITSFSDNTDKMVEKAVKDAKKKLKGNLKGIILDIRNNPGGLLDQAVSVSDLFLNQGEIVSTRSRNEEDTVKYNAKKGDIADRLPIVIIVNDGSASASEIVAGALQDHKRAVILGEKTFGKGSVQTVIPLGKHGAMRLTTARYYTPSGRSIQVKGIEPDVAVKPAKVEEIESPFELSEGEYNNALKNDSEEKVDAKKQAAKKAEKEELAKDYQLARALDLVRAMGIYEQGKAQK
ncbi:MAG: S41 family peptidase [Pseudomonadota bacterium]|nr:S41 family peptidase [Pseudomonadota bacterium]